MQNEIWLMGARNPTDDTDKLTLIPGGKYGGPFFSEDEANQRAKRSTEINPPIIYQPVRFIRA